MTVTAYPDPGIRAEMRWETEPAKLGTMRFGDPFAAHHYRLVVFDNGAEQTALDVFQQAYRDWQPVVDEPGVIRYPASGRLSSSSRKINDSYGRPVACRRPISQVRFAER